MSHHHKKYDSHHLHDQVGLAVSFKLTKLNVKTCQLKKVMDAGKTVLTNIAHLVDQLEQGILGGVHAHRPHGPAQLLRADVAAPVHVELIEGLGG